MAARWAIVVYLGLLMLAGCRGVAESPPLPDDPLFLSRKPHETRAVSVPAVALAHAEPTPPPNPYYAPDHPERPLLATPRLVPGILTNRPATTPEAPTP